VAPGKDTQGNDVDPSLLHQAHVLEPDGFGPLLWVVVTAIEHVGILGAGSFMLASWGRIRTVAGSVGNTFTLNHLRPGAYGDISDAEWEFAKGYLEIISFAAPQRKHDAHEILNALRWICKAEAPWKYHLPHDFPESKIVCQ
jgi:hypothetical protein